MKDGSHAQARGNFVRYSQRVALICFERDFLSQHDVARHEIAVRDKAPADAGKAGIIKFFYIRGGAVADPVSLSAMATGDLEAFVCIELRALRGR